MASSADLKDIFRAARPLIEQQLDLAEMVAALRDVATEKGLDWSQIKALLKAQIQDERDDNGGKRVKAIVAKAEHASAYADMLGLAKMNEENFSASQSYSEAKGREFPNEAPDLSGAETAELRSLTENQEIETSGGNGPAAAGQTADEASTSSGPVINSQATPPEPADIAGEATSSSLVSPATNSGSATPAGADGHPGEPSDDARAAEPGAEAPRIGAQSSRAVTSSDDDIPAFIKKDKPDCLKLKDGHCRLSFATSALCAECNQRRAMARALA